MKKANICWIWIKMIWSEFKLSFIIFAILFILMLITYKGNSEIFKLCGNVIIVIIGLFIYKAQRRVLLWDIRNRLICEYKEIYRHLTKNLEVLESIDIEQGIPSTMHIKKLKIDDHTTLNDGDIMKNLSKEYTSIVYPMTIRTRNYNITVDSLEKSTEFNDKELFKKYLNEMKESTTRLQTLISMDALKLGCDFNHIEKRSREIIYDKSWTTITNK